MKKNKLKYCCSSFKELCIAPNSAVPAIRIVKMTSERFLRKKRYIELWDYKIIIPRRKINKGPYNFYMTFGFEKFSLSYIIRRSIWYCPFCGQRLDKYYKSDEYVHEIEGETFKWNE